MRGFFENFTIRILFLIFEKKVQIFEILFSFFRSHDPSF